jgi:hypothetical protein
MSRKAMKTWMANPSAALLRAQTEYEQLYNRAPANRYKNNLKRLNELIADKKKE